MHRAIELLVATTSGNTEYLADQLAESLQAHGFTATVHYEPDYHTLLEQQTAAGQCWLCCVASHGAGEYADSMLDFIEQMVQHSPDLSGLQFAVIAVGDSNYDTFCAAGRDCDTRLAQLGAMRLLERLEIDMSCDDPETKAQQWLEQLITKM